MVKEYFPEITGKQESQFDSLKDLYTDWNNKVNLISRKDIDNLYEKHILHSLGIARVIRFSDHSAIMDVGTGGGFPGIPLAILFPNVSFLLLDSIGKKIKAAEDIARQIGLENVEFRQARVEDEKREFDFVVSRAVMPLSDLVKVARKNIAKKQRNALPNGFLCLKGGDLQEELKPFKNKVIEYELSDYFQEEFFKTKKVVYLPAHISKCNVENFGRSAFPKGS
ncbi:MAG: 16S rRNA (guanine(527)-N(7))-methyltransferase RsmG [Candidatus Symbiothrix sp.]|jgi:16S rRNA (guanine527-N7)-methyltransferase|nr:16S rRNA (guanine(527)-N(7))-methyltransferase RsmG [Candidatus Symbiothrix sp.]